MSEPLIKPAVKASRHWSDYLYRYFVAPPLLYSTDSDDHFIDERLSKTSVPLENEVHKESADESQQELGINDVKKMPKKTASEQFFLLLKRAYLQTYAFDGFNVTTNNITYANNITLENAYLDNNTVRKSQDKPSQTSESREFVYYGSKFSAWIYFTTFFGMPNRPDMGQVIDQENSWVEPTPKLSFTQFLKNLIGGWDWQPNTSNEKKIWQLLATPVKVFIILPIKILLIPIKTARNIAKLFSEFLPSIINSLMAQWLISLAKFTLEVSKTKTNLFLKGAALIGLGLLTFCLGILSYTLRIIATISRAATSPEKSSRMAFAYGRELKIEGRTENETADFADMVGSIAALISLTISATVWAIVLPLAIGGILYFPAVVQTLTWAGQLPAVVWAAHLPVVVKSLSIAKAALITVGSSWNAYLAPAFAPVSSFLGLQISATLLIIGSALGAVAAPILALLSRTADALSNAWARSYKNWPLTAFWGYLTKPKDKIQLLNEDQHNLTSAKSKNNDQHDFDHEAYILMDELPIKRSDSSPPDSFALSFLDAQKQLKEDARAFFESRKIPSQVNPVDQLQINAYWKKRDEIKSAISKETVPEKPAALKKWRLENLYHQKRDLPPKISATDRSLILQYWAAKDLAIARLNNNKILQEPSILINLKAALKPHYLNSATEEERSDNPAPGQGAK